MLYTPSLAYPTNHLPTLLQYARNNVRDHGRISAIVSARLEALVHDVGELEQRLIQNNMWKL
jgi:hypothetical protein